MGVLQTEEHRDGAHGLVRRRPWVSAMPGGVIAEIVASEVHRLVWRRIDKPAWIDVIARLPAPAAAQVVMKAA
jgi:hypothetical protein